MSIDPIDAITQLVDNFKDPANLRAERIPDAIKQQCRKAAIAAMRAEPAFTAKLERAKSLTPEEITRWTMATLIPQLMAVLADTKFGDNPEFTVIPLGMLKQIGASFQGENPIHAVRIDIEEYGLEAGQIPAIGNFVLDLAEKPREWQQLVRDASSD